jgi:hypothetical protein
MSTYTTTILPLCQGIVKCAKEQNAAFFTNYEKPGEVKYYEKSVAHEKVTHPQRLDDFYGALFYLAGPLPASDKEKKKAIETCLNEYHYKKPSARSYLVLCQGRGVSKAPKTPVQWFDETQKTLNQLIQNLHLKLNAWKA